MYAHTYIHTYSTRVYCMYIVIAWWLQALQSGKQVLLSQMFMGGEGVLRAEQYYTYNTMLHPLLVTHFNCVATRQEWCLNTAATNHLSLCQHNPQHCSLPYYVDTWTGMWVSLTTSGVQWHELPTHLCSQLYRLQHNHGHAQLGLQHHERCLQPRV